MKKSDIDKLEIDEIEELIKQLSDRYYELQMIESNEISSSYETSYREAKGIV